MSYPLIDFTACMRAGKKLTGLKEIICVVRVCAHCLIVRIVSSGPRTMEQSSIAPERGGLTVQSISAVAKDIFVWMVGPRRSVNYFNCAA